MEQPNEQRGHFRTVGRRGGHLTDDESDGQQTREADRGALRRSPPQPQRASGGRGRGGAPKAVTAGTAHRDAYEQEEMGGIPALRMPGHDGQLADRCRRARRMKDLPDENHDRRDDQAAGRRVPGRADDLVFMSISYSQVALTILLKGARIVKRP